MGVNKKRKKELQVREPLVRPEKLNTIDEVRRRYADHAEAAF
jgi:hypothetical protein